MSEFSPGFAVIFDDQHYQPTRLIAHQGADRVPKTYVEWASYCAACDQPFLTTTPLRVRAFTRRCSACAVRGKRIDDDERTRIRQRWSAR